MIKNKIILTTGGFDPIHSGHIKYLQAAKDLGKYLVVGINSDKWLTKKKGKYFLPLIERTIIIKNLKMVDEVIKFNDDDGTAINAIETLLTKYPKRKIIFANGGDRDEKNIPELIKMKNNHNVEFLFGIGGNEKINSSSWILKEWNKK